MKNFRALLMIIVLIPFLGFSQKLENIDYISPFHDGYASIKQGDKWAFINERGDIVIDFRDDLVPGKNGAETYPIIKNGRCIIQKIEANITYFGFIDKFGKTVIAPQYIKVNNFEYDRAIVLMQIKQKLGHNNLLNKPVVSYKYREILIDKSGEIKDYLGPLYPFSKSEYTKICPVIKSKIISKNLIKIEDDNSFYLKSF